MAARNQRHKLPYVEDAEVHLNFNYWQEKVDKFLLPSDLTEVVRGISTGDSSIPCVSTFGQQETGTLVVVVLNGLESERLMEHIEDVPFLSNATSAPLVAVRKLQIPKATDKVTSNPNLWFYNDVKSAEGEMLNVSIPSIPAENCTIYPEAALFHQSASITFHLRHIAKRETQMEIHKVVVFRPNCLSQEEIDVVRQAAKTKLQLSMSLSSLAKQYQQDNTFLQLTFAAGRFTVPDTTGKGISI